jgi:tRNA 2-thiouridine synthesizing protein A
MNALAWGASAILAPLMESSKKPEQAVDFQSQAGCAAPDEQIDTVGLFCPVPIIKTAARIRGMKEGKILEVVSDDRVILVDMPNWCRGAGHDYLGNFEAEREIHLFVRKGVRRKSPAQRK